MRVSGMYVIIKLLYLSSRGNASFFVGCFWAYCITETLAAFMQTCAWFAKNHFLSISIFFSKIIFRIFSPRSV